jgi:hypothetical protein
MRTEVNGILWGGGLIVTPTKIQNEIWRV